MSAVDRLIAESAAFDHGPRADQLFFEAMRENYRHHYRGCPDYARYCDLFDFKPGEVCSYQDVFRIPHVFVANFKRRKFVTGDESRIALTLTSSGTAGEKSAIYLDRRSLRRITDIVHHIYAAFDMRCPEEETNYLAFTYDPRVAKDLGTAFSDKLLTGLTRVGKVHYAIRWIDGEFKLDRAAVWRALERFAREKEPLRVLGFPALIWEVFEEFRLERGRTFDFGPRSYVITGGGWKNKADKEIPKSAFRAGVATFLGMPASNVRDLYGMVEHGVPYCECEHNFMHVPIYSRVVARDPGTLRILPPGEAGVLHMLTPYLNSFPALSLLTSDVGRLHADCPCGRRAPRLELLGRGGITRQRGCAIAALDVLQTPASPVRDGQPGESAAEPTRNLTHDHYLFGRFESGTLDAAKVEQIIRDARLAQERLETVPLSHILQVFDEVSRRWRDPEYPGRRQALQHMPEVVGFSQPMVEAALDALCDVMQKSALEKKIRLELGAREALDGWRWRAAYQGYLRAQALGVVLHVSAGNVFVSGADSLLHGLVTRNASLLKVSRADPLFPLLFARSVQEVDHTGLVGTAMAVLAFRGGEAEVERTLKRLVDGIVVWGGEDAVAAWRRELPERVRLIPHGPKYSFAILTSQGMLSSNITEVCLSVARDVVLWEQRACSSPQVLYVDESQGDALTDMFVEELGKALDVVGAGYPPARLEPDERVEILRHRELARMAQAFGESTLVSGRAWTIIRENSLDFKFSPLNRTIYLKGFRKWDEVLAQARALRGYVQTVSVLGVPREMRRIATDLARVGVDRITEVGAMATGKPGSPHDGTYPLQDLVRWVSIESVRERFDLGESLAPPGEGLKKWARLQDLLAYVREHSPFYARRLGTMSFAEYHAFERIPFLDRGDIYRHTPPQGEGLLTGPLENAYVFASGGSTGEPKFSFYSYEEFDRVTDILSEIYQVAGVRSDDVVGNLFMAGNLWTSFIVANEALEKIGCVTLPIAGNADINLVVRYLRLFEPTVLIGLPSIMIQLAEAVKVAPDIRVRLILYGGEHVSHEARAFLSEALGCEAIVSAGYASVDAGPVGYQCPQSPRTVHHLLYDYQFLEFIDPATGETVPKGQTGEIVVTNLNRRLMPVIRFRTGDLGRRVEGVCPCGRLGPVFELLGRCDDVVRVGSVSIYPEEIESVLAQVEGISRLFQIVAEGAGAKDRLVVRAESPNGGDVLARQIERLLLEQNTELAEALREGWLGELRVEVMPPGGIPRIRRTGKIRKVVDLRGISQSPS
ncbi:MAG: AMP-binding protein [Armatimonadetes bacterium]|nr:AMP-binding protein [Armatimonadota bacterium]